MRVGVVFFADRERKRLLALARGLATGLESQGHEAEVIDGIRDVNSKLTAKQYIVVGTESLSITGKIPSRVAPFLSSAGLIQGKRSYAFVAKSFLGSSRALVKAAIALLYSLAAPSGARSSAVSPRIALAALYVNRSSRWLSTGLPVKSDRAMLSAAITRSPLAALVVASF